MTYPPRSMRYLLLGAEASNSNRKVNCRLHLDDTFPLPVDLSAPIILPTGKTYRPIGFCT